RQGRPRRATTWDVPIRRRSSSGCCPRAAAGRGPCAGHSTGGRLCSSCPDGSAQFHQRRGLFMELGLYGLGRMGGNMVTRLAQGGHRVVAGNRSQGPVQEAVTHGAVAASSIAEMVKLLKAPRVLWAMVPSGAVTDETLDEFAKHASKGDVLVDG